MEHKPVMAFPKDFLWGGRVSVINKDGEFGDEGEDFKTLIAIL